MYRLAIVAIILLAAAPLAAQSQPPQTLPEVGGLEQAPPPPPTHDITQVDPAPLGGAIAIPLTERDRKKLKKYEIPELADCRQAIGSQRIDGRLPKPLVDYSMSTSAVYQRLSIFERGLEVVESRRVRGTIRKHVIIPDSSPAILPS